MATAKASYEKLYYYGTIYEPYLNLACRFETDNIVSLFSALSEEEKNLFDFDVQRLNWRHYMQNVHIPGLRKHILKQEGYISNYKLLSDSKNKNSLLVDLKYYNGLPVIKEIKRISKPGRRIYARADSIPRIQNGLGLAIVSTSKGIMSDYEAKNNNVGGEIICKVF